MKRHIIIFILLLAFGINGKAQARVGDSYNMEFYRYYYTDDPKARVAADEYVKKVSGDEGLRKNIDDILHHFESTRHVALVAQLKTSTIERFVGFYTFLTFTKGDIAMYLDRSPLSDRAIAQSGFIALKKYASTIMDGPTVMLEKLWIKQLELPQEKFNSYLAKINENRPSGKPGLPYAPGRFNAVFWDRYFSLVNEYAYVNIMSVPKHGSIIIDNMPQKTAQTDTELIVPMKHSPSVIMVIVTKRGYKPSSTKATVNDYKLTNISTTLKKL